MSAIGIPVSFYFQVTFQNSKGEIFQTSFTEVRGIGWKLTPQEERVLGLNVKSPGAMTQNELVLVRPIMRTGDAFTDWVKKCSIKLAFLSAKDKMLGVETCDVVVKLMSNSGNLVAVWSFCRAYPVDYSLGNLKSSESGLATETVTLSYYFGWRAE